jgi:hypothetical protein
MAVIVCAGGGYGRHDWKTHVVYAARVFNPMGVAVIGLKWQRCRACNRHRADNEAVEACDDPSGSDALQP